MSPVIERAVPPAPATHGDRKSRRSIKLLSCIVRREKFDAVMEAINRLGLVGGMTVTDVRGLGSGREEPELFRGARFVAAYAPRVRIEVAIEANDVEAVEKLVETIARTGDVGDGKIFIMNLVDLMRIRTGERGGSAL